MAMSEGVQASTKAPAILELRGLAKSYGRLRALDGLDLTVREGEVYGFLGRNGAGKSTTIRIIMGITKATAGEVRLFAGEGDRGVIAQRQQIGYVAQEQSFYGWMTPLQLGRFVRGFYPTWDDSEFRRVLDLLDVPRARKVRTFSGGMKVKLALALALAHRPRLLVLDEPTAGLDPVARREFLEMVRQQAREARRTTFFSTHLVDEVELAASRLGIVDGGKTIFEGSEQELLARVRRLRAPLHDVAAPPPLPATLTAALEQGAALRVLRDEQRGAERVVVVATADPTLWSALAGGFDAWQVESMPLEETFIELVGKRMAWDGSPRS